MRLPLDTAFHSGSFCHSVVASLMSLRAAVWSRGGAEADEGVPAFTGFSPLPGVSGAVTVVWFAATGPADLFTCVSFPFSKNHAPTATTNGGRRMAAMRAVFGGKGESVDRF